MRPSRCSLLQPQEELQVGPCPRHRITSALPEIASTKSYAFLVFVGVVVFLVSVFVGVVVFVVFVPVTPLYALP